MLLCPGPPESATSRPAPFGLRRCAATSSFSVPRARPLWSSGTRRSPQTNAESDTQVRMSSAWACGATVSDATSTARRIVAWRRLTAADRSLPRAAARQPPCSALSAPSVSRSTAAEVDSPGTGPPAIANTELPSPTTPSPWRGLRMSGSERQRRRRGSNASTSGIVLPPGVSSSPPTSTSDPPAAAAEVPPRATREDGSRSQRRRPGPMRSAARRLPAAAVRPAST